MKKKNIFQNRSQQLLRLFEKAGLSRMLLIMRSQDKLLMFRFGKVSVTVALPIIVSSIFVIMVLLHLGNWQRNLELQELLLPVGQSGGWKKGC